ncbi:MAG TPA: heme-binding protein [Chloroflexota bacterium]|nr:heme-binding protein [Chloroflexota bacterium]
MTYVITEPCIGTKEGSCVEVCPAGCIHTTPDAPQNFIDPDVCIECEQCLLVCPVNAIFLDTDVPTEWQDYIEINASFFRANKVQVRVTPEVADHMVQLAVAYAGRAGAAVAVVVVDAAGAALASHAMPGSPAGALELASKKAYTALTYQLATHELRPGRTPPWARETVVDPARVLMAAGGLPLVEHRDILAAIGVAGAPTADVDLLCAQAGLAARPGAAVHA